MKKVDSRVESRFPPLFPLPREGRVHLHGTPLAGPAPAAHASGPSRTPRGARERPRRRGSGAADWTSAARRVETTRTVPRAPGRSHTYPGSACPSRAAHRTHLVSNNHTLPPARSARGCPRANLLSSNGQRLLPPGCWWQSPCVERSTTLTCSCPAVRKRHTRRRLRIRRSRYHSTASWARRGAGSATPDRRPIRAPQRVPPHRHAR
jgi:hypothetical protein